MTKSLIEKEPKWFVLVGLSLAILLIILISILIILPVGESPSDGPPMGRLGIAEATLSSTNGSFTVNLTLLRDRIHKNKYNTSIQIIYFGRNKSVINTERIKIGSIGPNHYVSKSFSEKPCLIWVKGPDFDKYVRMQGATLVDGDDGPYVVHPGPGHTTVPEEYNYSVCS